MTAWGSLPPAPPPHGTVLAWARGCRCEQCEHEYQRFVSELALRGPLRLPAAPEPRKLDADTRASLGAPCAVRCAISGAATWRSPSISRRRIPSAEAADEARLTRQVPVPGA